MQDENQIEISSIGEESTDDQIQNDISENNRLYNKRKYQKHLNGAVVFLIFSVVLLVCILVLVKASGQSLVALYSDFLNSVKDLSLNPKIEQPVQKEDIVIDGVHYDPDKPIAHYAPGNYTPTADVYSALSEPFKSGASVNIKGHTLTEIKQEFTKLQLEHPGIFWVTGFSYMELQTNYGPEFDITFPPREEGIGQKINALEVEVNRIIDQIPDGLSDYQKALFVHDYIVNTVSYDSNAEHCHDAYGCLIGRKAVCSGYARAFKLLMDRLEIPCLCVSGEVVDIGRHEWNVITLDEENYIIDVTLDDRNDDLFCSHACFCVSEEITRNRVIDAFLDVPTCTSNKYDYYKDNGLLFEKYDPEKVIKFIAKNYFGQWVEIKFSDKDMCASMFDFFDSENASKRVSDFIYNNYKPSGYRWCTTSSKKVIAIKIY